MPPSACAVAGGLAPTPPIPQVELDTTAGKIRIELYPDAAPKTVENFLAYVQAKHYDGTQFHRVIPGFMIQGGGYTADFREKPTRPPVPQRSRAEQQGGLAQRPGSVAMARTSDPEFGDGAVLHQRRRQQVPELPRANAAGHGYTVFGKVVAGMDVVNKIAEAPTGSGGPFPRDVPVERVLIKSATVVQRAVRGREP